MKKIVFGLGIGLLAFSGAAMAQTSAQAPAQATAKTTAKAAAKSPLDGKIKFKEETIDFGTTKLNKPATVEFVFTNISKDPLIIQSAQPSCGCTTPAWTKEPVLPGKQGTIKATYNAASVGQVNKTV